jgi:diguanylate cyclase (GGDEF)-like protein
MRDVSERKRHEKQILDEAYYDPTTGLPNRLYILERLGEKLSDKVACTANDFALVLLDVDQFGDINDSFGRDVGEELLIDVAKRLSNGISGAIVASDGNGVFLLLFSTSEGEVTIKERTAIIQSDLAAAFYLNGHEIFISISIGVTLPAMGYDDGESMIRTAEIAANQAKIAGAGHALTFDPNMRDQALYKLQLEADLRRAIEREEIIVYYQPIVDLKTGRIHNVEALVRWQHPENGIIPPGTFIPIAEATGLIHPISTQVLRQAAGQMKQWQNKLGDLAPSKISVNLSAHQFSDPNLVTEIAIILAQADLQGQYLKFELTESAIMNTPDHAKSILIDLKELGASLAIDDFGTGYSSLSYLHQFPFDSLKIDRQFVIAMEEQDENMEIIKTIILLAHNLDMDIIAEGIETIEHMTTLQRLGCEWGQGYLFDRPMPGDDLSKILIRQLPYQDLICHKT